MQQPPYYNQQPPGPYGYPPPPPMPPPKRSPWRRFRALPKIVQIVAWVVVGMVILIAGISGSHDSNTPPAIDGSTPTTAQAATKTTPAPTLPPTATPKPTATPTALQRIQDQTLQLAKDTTEFGHNLTSKATAGAVTINETIGEALDNDGAKTEIKTDCFNIQKAIWQKGVAGVTGITVKISGPLQDQYGKQSTGLIGACSLSDLTAKQFQWDNLDWRTAWDSGDYDVVYLLPSLNT